MKPNVCLTGHSPIFVRIAPSCSQPEWAKHGGMARGEEELRAGVVAAEVPGALLVRWTPTRPRQTRRSPPRRGNVRCQSGLSSMHAMTAQAHEPRFIATGSCGWLSANVLFSVYTISSVATCFLSPPPPTPPPPPSPGGGVSSVRLGDPPARRGPVGDRRHDAVQRQRQRGGGAPREAQARRAAASSSCSSAGDVKRPALSRQLPCCCHAHAHPFMLSADNHFFFSTEICMLDVHVWRRAKAQH